MLDGVTLGNDEEEETLATTNDALLASAGSPRSESGA